MNRLVVGSSLVAAAGAVTAIAAAVQHNYGICSIALFAVAAGAYLLSRFQDAANDRAVLHRLQEQPQQPVDALADELGLRRAAVQLSIHRLVRSGELPSNADSAE
ncbi:hypothetical protein [Streptomyces sp. NPDC094144]|uniref:hypothetical protein n=1 Tax=Streptomyces sp. NPDC094144 TaxID=3366056 RepID=UPI003814E6FE